MHRDTEPGSASHVDALSLPAKIFVALGLAVLLVPSTYVVTAARSEFGRLVCVPQCAPEGMGYRIIHAASGWNGYPGQCMCIKHEAVWWDFWNKGGATAVSVRREHLASKPFAHIHQAWDFWSIGKTTVIAEKEYPLRSERAYRNEGWGGEDSKLEGRFLVGRFSPDILE